jgi:D-alanyl-D-alanine carboxypeptidase/D-alanyl-D-alanine-endopeptidase (penicillin-binding protein 4)
MNMLAALPRRPLARLLMAGALLASAACAATPAPPAVTAPEISGVRLGVYVAALDGKPVFADHAGDRFIPASNTKIFTAAAAFHYIEGVDQPDPALATRLLLVPGDAAAPPSLVLKGEGDATVRDDDTCVINCLRELADAVVAAGITRVADVYGDDSAFPFEPFGMGWSWNNLPFYFGAPVSALTVNGNAAALRIAPGATEGDSVDAAWLAGEDLLRVRNEAVTSAPGSELELSVLRWPGSDEVHLTGTLPAGTSPRNYFLSVPDAPLAAAERLVRLLSARGVEVVGAAKVRTRSDPEPTQELARLSPPPLLDSVVDVLEDSDNLSAELLLRHVARATGGQGADDGIDAVNAMLVQAGIDSSGVEIFDGSGLSPYNRITPLSTVRFLSWTAVQPWGDSFRKALPVGGQSGSLARRFRGTALDGRIFAKTGTVQGVNALSGFLVAASGETLVFSVMANDRPVGADPVVPLIDALLLEIAAAN